MLLWFKVSVHQDITPAMDLNRASCALEAHTSPTMEEHSASLVEVA